MVKTLSSVTVSPSDWQIHVAGNALATEDDLFIVTEDNNYFAVDDESLCTYKCVISPAGVTASTKVDIQLTSDIVNQAIVDKTFAYGTVNTNGVVTLYCSTVNKPSANITFNCILNPVSAPNIRVWNDLEGSTWADYPSISWIELTNGE